MARREDARLGASGITARRSRSRTDQMRAESDTVPRAVGYVRRSKTRRDRDGKPLPDQHGIAAQRSAITQRCRERGWTLVEITEDDGRSGATTARRPGLADALAALADGRADTLVVAKLDRLARSLVDFARIMADSREQGWSLVVLDLDIDTTTRNGRLFAGILAQLAEWEREMISERTRDGLCEARASGQELGRKSNVPKEVINRILSERKGGASFGAIADGLDADQIPTPGGSPRWRVGAVRDIYRRLATGAVDSLLSRKAVA